MWFELRADRYWFSIALLLLSHLLTACVQFPPSRSYDADFVNYQPSAGMSTARLTGQRSTIQANQPWQASGVRVGPGDRVKIVAIGKWSQAPAFNIWSGPEGMGGSGGKEVPWVKQNALMGKIGEQGRPFEVGAALELQSTGEGDIYLAINDPFDWVKDNSGSMEVTIFTERSSAAPTTVASVNSGANLVPSQRTNEPLPGPGDFEKRTALIIGNSEYEIGGLKNPANDAQDMGATLAKLGFDVTLKLNASQEQMEQAIGEFGRKLYQGGIGLFYYAGHGVQVDGENYLIPVKAKMESESDVRYKAVNIGQVLGKMGEARNGFNIVILDACRDNPFAKSFRSATRGLAVVNSASVKGTLVAYATSPGHVASDGDGRNGLYTKHLLQQLAAPAVPVEQVFKRVLQGVERDTDGKQSPWTSSSFSGEFYFNPGHGER